MKIGIYGGTFNPIHYGHLININLVMDEFGFDKILLIPAFIPVHKNISENITAVNRLEMTQIAVKKREGFEVSTIEIDREEPSYTIDTIAEIQKKYKNDDIYLIIGSDSYDEIETWKDYKKILKKVPIIVMKRPGYGKSFDREVLKRIEFAENPFIDISSTFIRNRIKLNQSVNFLLPDEVITYIKEKRLYIN